METGTGPILEVTKVSVLDWVLDCKRALWRTSALVSALANLRLVTIGIPNSAAFLLMRDSSFRNRLDVGSPSWLGMVYDKQIILFFMVIILFRFFLFVFLESILH